VVGPKTKLQTIITSLGKKKQTYSPTVTMFLNTSILLQLAFYMYF